MYSIQDSYEKRKKEEIIGRPGQAQSDNARDQRAFFTVDIMTHRTRRSTVVTNRMFEFHSAALV